MSNSYVNVYRKRVTFPSFPMAKSATYQTTGFHWSMRSWRSWGYGMTVKYASFTTMVNELHLRRKIFAQHALKGGMMMGAGGWGLVVGWSVTWEILGNPGNFGDLWRFIWFFFSDLSIKYRRLRWIACDFLMFFDDNGDKSRNGCEDHGNVENYMVSIDFRGPNLKT